MSYQPRQSRELSNLSGLPMPIEMLMIQLNLRVQLTEWFFQLTALAPSAVAVESHDPLSTLLRTSKRTKFYIGVSSLSMLCLFSSWLLWKADDFVAVNAMRSLIFNFEERCLMSLSADYWFFDTVTTACSCVTSWTFSRSDVSSTITLSWLLYSP